MEHHWIPVFDGSAETSQIWKFCPAAGGWFDFRRNRPPVAWLAFGSTVVSIYWRCAVLSRRRNRAFVGGTAAG